MHMLDSLRDIDRPVTELLCNREFSYKKEEDWAAELCRRGIAQVIDMHDGDRGARDYNGIAMIDRTPHCRAVLGDRDHLIRIQRLPTLSAGTLKTGTDDNERREHEARVVAIAEFKAQIAERAVAAFRRGAGPDADGNEHLECPA